MILRGTDMTEGFWDHQLPTEEGIYKMKTPDGNIEIVKIENLVIDNNPARPKSLHVIHINGDDPDDPEYYSLRSLSDEYEYSWQRQLQ